MKARSSQTLVALVAISFSLLLPPHKATSQTLPDAITATSTGVPNDGTAAYIAKMGRSQTVKITAEDQSLAKLIYETCGYNTVSLVREGLAINGLEPLSIQAAFKPIGNNKGTAEIPACLRASTPTSYTIKPGDTYFKLAQQNMGFTDSNAPAERAFSQEFCRLNLTLVGHNCDKGIKPGGIQFQTFPVGKTITLPATAQATTIVLKPGITAAQFHAGLVRLPKSPSSDLRVRRLLTVDEEKFGRPHPNSVVSPSLSGHFVMLASQPPLHPSPWPVPPPLPEPELYKAEGQWINAFTETLSNFTESYACQSSDIGSAPFKLDLVYTLWHETKAKLAASSEIRLPHPVRIAILDSGVIQGSIPSKWIARFRSNPGAPEEEDGAYAGNDEAFGGFYTPRPEDLITSTRVQRDHGTHVAGLAIGGPEFIERIEKDGDFPFRLRFYLALQRGESAPAKWGLTYLAVQSALRYLDYLHDNRQSDGLILANASLESNEAIVRPNAVLKEKILLIVAAGNTPGGKMSISPPRVFRPAQLGGPTNRSAITVGAYDVGKKTAANFTNISMDHVDLFAPGVCLESYGGPDGNEKVAYSGTSQAAPLVTFAAALLHSLGFIRPADIKHRILSTVEFSPDLVDKAHSFGLLNIAKALDLHADHITLKEEAGGTRLRGIIEDQAIEVCRVENKPIYLARVNRFIVPYDKQPNAVKILMKPEINSEIRFGLENCSVASPNQNLSITVFDNPTKTTRTLQIPIRNIREINSRSASFDMTFLNKTAHLWD